jgi:hypothetical protein
VRSASLRWPRAWKGCFLGPPAEWSVSCAGVRSEAATERAAQPSLDGPERFIASRRLPELLRGSWRGSAPSGPAGRIPSCHGGPSRLRALRAPRSVPLRQQRWTSSVLAGQTHGPSRLSETMSRRATGAHTDPVRFRCDGIEEGDRWCPLARVGLRPWSTRISGRS